MKKNEVKFSELVKSLPDQRLNTVEITDVDNVVKVGEKECLPINCVDKNGKAHEGILVPTDDEDLTFDQDTLELKGGSFSRSGKSISSPNYDWEIQERANNMTPLKELTGTEAVEA